MGRKQVGFLRAFLGLSCEFPGIASCDLRPATYILEVNDETGQWGDDAIIHGGGALSGGIMPDGAVVGGSGTAAGVPGEGGVMHPSRAVAET